MDQRRVKMERLLEDASKAYREVAATTTAWIRNTHHWMQLQKFRWVCLERAVRERAVGIQNLTVEGRCMQRNQDRCEEKLKQLEQLISEQGRALTELRTKWEDELQARELKGPVIKGPPW